MATPGLTQSTVDFRRGLLEGLEVFDVIEDPRSGDAPRPFGSILFITLCATLCGMDSCEDFVRFAKARDAWLRKWVALPKGIPCGDTFLRVFAAINPATFTERLTTSELPSESGQVSGCPANGSRPVR